MKCRVVKNWRIHVNTISLFDVFPFLLAVCFLRTMIVPSTSYGETILIFLLILVLSIIGVGTIRRQLRLLRRRLQHTSEEKDAKASSMRLREIQKIVQQKQLQSHEELAEELESMREMQREVRAELINLQMLVEKVSTQREKKK